MRREGRGSLAGLALAGDPGAQLGAGRRAWVRPLNLPPRGLVRPRRPRQRLGLGG